mmetsp:Transcript_21489/g.55823  ORF Transcript_21489/g.55823 Transcript_21489/m.55823 type:complete len:245 (-) Transcript_21489:16-750(-)
MGTIMEPIPAEKMSTEETLPKSSIPSSFDSRQQWPNCVTPIRNQGQCGSCWAFGAAESFSDRLCIASGGQTSIVLSPEQLVSCDWEGNMGCNGGIPHLAWDYFEAFGIVSDSCFPYSAGTGSAPKCAKTCADGQPWTTHKTKLFSTKGYSGVEAIQTAIMTSGPVEGTISVYKDFMSYTSGVYEHTTGDYLISARFIFPVFSCSHNLFTPLLNDSLILTHSRTHFVNHISSPFPPLLFQAKAAV